MRMTYRQGRGEDAEDCGAVFHEAFKHIAEQHNFPVDFPEPETAVSILTMLLSRDDLYSVIAEGDGVIVGSNFLWESDSIFMPWIKEGKFFSAKFEYEGDTMRGYDVAFYS